MISQSKSITDLFVSLVCKKPTYHNVSSCDIILRLLAETHVKLTEIERIFEELNLTQLLEDALSSSKQQAVCLQCGCSSIVKATGSTLSVELVKKKVRKARGHIGFIFFVHDKYEEEYCLVPPEYQIRKLDGPITHLKQVENILEQFVCA